MSAVWTDDMQVAAEAMRREGRRPAAIARALGTTKETVRCHLDEEFRLMRCAQINKRRNPNWRPARRQPGLPRLRFLERGL